MIVPMSILIIGGTGSLGKKLIQRLLPTNCVSVYSRDEGKHWALRNEFSVGQLAPHIKKLQFYVGDIRDVSRLRDVIRQENPETIIIAAALKQVDTCELSPNESIATNLAGTQNVINVINEMNPTNLRNVLFVSTDKACAPVNVYGMCKAISERVVTSQGATGLQSVKYLCVRYGNVLESRGSIVPLFKYQAENNEFLTVTDPNMTRFLMTLDQSVDLIMHTIENGASGETWIPQLPAMKVGDLASIFAKRHGKQIKIIGPRPGEKQHEDLLNASESVRTSLERTISNLSCLVIQPAFKSGNAATFTYTSNQNVMTADELEAYLEKLGILDMPIEKFSGHSVEEIMTNRKS